MTGLARRDDIVPDVTAAQQIATSVANTDFVPRSLRGNKHAVLAAILTGRELGIGPMQALQSIHVVDGRPTLSAELMRALVLSQGHRIVVRETDAEHVVVWGRRADSGDELAVAWTLDDAKRAGLLGKSNWRSYPAQMLLARGTSQLCRSLFPDVLAGVSYVPEELGHDSTGEAAPAVADVVSVSPHGGGDFPGGTDLEWEDATPAALPDDDALAEAAVVDVAPVPAPDKVLADPQARISRRQSQELLKRMEALDPADQDRLRTLWSENRWPQHPDGRLRPTLLTESQHLLATQLLDTWTPPPDPEPGPDGGEIAEAVELVEQGGLT